MRLPGLLLLAMFLTGAVRAAEPILLPNGAELKDVDFDRHVAPLLSRLGCNSGACHGSFQGKGGLRLSLFGYSPADDYKALTHAAQGRRVNVSRPDASLLLLKPTLQVAHEGGTRLQRDSWQHVVIRRWIEQGANRNASGSHVERIELRLERDVVESGSATSFVVLAEFSDGATDDVTPFCAVHVQDDSIAQIDASGSLNAVHPGDTAVIGEYRGRFVAARILVPVSESERLPWPGLQSAGFIDDEVFSKLRGLGITPSDPCSDTDFLRRVTIDVIGRIPTPDEVREFLEEQRPDRRGRVVERLLSHPMHAALWATRLCDITGNNVDLLPGDEDMQARRAKMWHDWFRRRIADNVPYNEIVRGALTATSRGDLPLSQWIEREAGLVRAARSGFDTNYAEQPYLDLYWRRSTEQAAEITAAAFLGVRIACARCHKHPFDRWTQDDYRAFSNIFAQVRTGSSPELRAAVSDVLEQRRKLRAGGEPLPPPLPRLTEVFLAAGDGGSDVSTPVPKALAGPEWEGSGDLRREFCDWLVEPDNPFFARNFVNRVWAHYFGVGLVDPVDDFSIVNPPSNSRLLDRLAADFAESGCNIRRLERQILNSRTYQLSATPNRTNRFDRRNFSRAYVRTLPAEVAVDSLQTALGVTFDFGPEVPAGCRAIEIAPNQLRRSDFARVFRIFERPERRTVCDCERSGEPNIRQTLYLMTEPRLLEEIRSGRLQQLLEDGRTDEAIIDELFLATLSRFPTQAERSTARQHLQNSPDRDRGGESLFWSLLNTREFVTNH